MAATLALALTSVFALLLIGHLVLGERPSTLRHQMLQLTAAAVGRQRPMADLLRRAAADQRRRDQRILLAVADELDGGQTLGDALQTAAPQHVTAAQCSALRAAEGQANFGSTLEGMGHTAGASLTAGARLHLALAYPALLAVGFILPTTAAAWVANFNVRGGPTPAATPDHELWMWAAVGAVILYVGLARMLGATATGLAVFGHIRHAMARPLDAIIPNRTRQRRAAFLATVAADVRSGRPLHQTLEDADPNGAAAQLASSGGHALEIWRAAGLGPHDAARAAGAGPHGLADALQGLADRDMARIHRANERLLHWIPIAAVLGFGFLIAREFQRVMGLTGAVLEEIAGW